MMTRSRTLVRCLALLGLSVLATIALALVQPSVRPPRWDLFLCLAVAAIAATAGALLLRRRQAETPSSGTHWWVDQRNGWVDFLAWSWLAPVFFVAYAAMSPTPAAWEIVDAGSTMRTTEIREVLTTEYVRSQRTGHYTSTVRVSVPYDQGPKLSEAEMISSQKPEAGEAVLVLLAPSSPEAGFFVGDRQSLEEKIGGRADFWMIFSALGFLALCWLVNLFGRWRADPVSGLHLSRQRGMLHSLSVSISGVGVALDKRPPSTSATARLKPHISLSCAEFGELHLYLDDIVDPEALASSLTDARGHVYWRRSTQQLTYTSSVGYGVLVLADQRYVSGWLESADSSVALPESARVPSDGELPAVGEPRAVHPASPVEANANVTILSALVISIAALAVITMGVGDAATVALATLSALVVMMGRRRARLQVKAHLEGLAPGGGPNIGHMSRT